MENLFERFEEEIRTDDECTDKKSRRLKSTYATLSSNEKDIVDDMFITLCGWSLKTFINQNK